MNVIDIQEQLERIDRLIRLKETGNPKDLSIKLGLSERHIYRVINHLKEIGCPIYYDKERCSYCYSKKGKLSLKFVPEEMDYEYLKKVKGGVYSKYQNIFLTDNICQWSDIILY